MENKTYEIIQIDDASWRIEDDVVRMFLFTGSERALLVDTGFGGSDLKSVIGRLTDLPLTLINTHADEDHTGGNAAFDEAFIHPAEYAYYGEKGETGAKPAAIWEGDVIDLGGGAAFEVILTPGHTPGSVCLLDRSRKLLVGGDTISASPIFLFGDVRSVPAYIVSLEKLLRLRLRDLFDTIYPSHGPFPLDAGIIDDLRDGAVKLLNGELQPHDPPFELPAKMFGTGRASFFY
jgi:glyoxylase-like metal-dependent hydrolase (beta-lactamase superfamily II)